MKEPHTITINHLIHKFNLQSYLELGLHKRENNFDLIKCKFKISVDPLPECLASFTGTSDEFFEYNTRARLHNYLGADVDASYSFDIIFIDGLHHSEQVRKDFINSLMCLNDKGFILIHDTDPKEERYAVWPRMEPRRWNGDVFKFITELPGYSQIDWRTPDIDANGLTVVKRSNRVKYESPFKGCDWKTFNENRKQILQLCSKEEFEQWI